MCFLATPSEAAISIWIKSNCPSSIWLSCPIEVTPNDRFLAIPKPHNRIIVKLSKHQLNSESRQHPAFIMRHQSFLTLLATVTLHASGIASHGANLASSSVPLERPLTELFDSVGKRHLKAEDDNESMDSEERNVKTEAEAAVFTTAVKDLNLQHSENILPRAVEEFGAKVESVEEALKNMETKAQPVPKNVEASGEAKSSPPLKAPKNDDAEVTGEVRPPSPFRSPDEIKADAKAKTTEGESVPEKFKTSGTAKAIKGEEAVEHPSAMRRVINWLKDFINRIIGIFRWKKSQPESTPSTKEISEIPSFPKSIPKDTTDIKMTESIKTTTSEKKAEGTAEGSPSVTTGETINPTTSETKSRGTSEDTPAVSSTVIAGENVNPKDQKLKAEPTPGESTVVGTTETLVHPPAPKQPSSGTNEGAGHVGNSEANTNSGTLHSPKKTDAEANTNSETFHSSTSIAFPNTDAEANTNSETIRAFSKGPSQKRPDTDHVSSSSPKNPSRMLEMRT
ncbi:hypothetical protein Plhal304r1_c060g0146561 [Plasmopara halstedii]